MVVIIERCGF